MPEKIVTAYQAVLDQHFDEDTALNKCKSTVSVLEKIKKNIDDASTKGKDLSCSLVINIVDICCGRKFDTILICSAFFLVCMFFHKVISLPQQ